MVGNILVTSLFHFSDIKLISAFKRDKYMDMKWRLKNIGKCMRRYDQSVEKKIQKTINYTMC